MDVEETSGELIPASREQRLARSLQVPAGISPRGDFWDAVRIRRAHKILKDTGTSLKMQGGLSLETHEELGALLRPPIPDLELLKPLGFQLLLVA